MYYHLYIENRFSHNDTLSQLPSNIMIHHNNKNTQIHNT